MTENFPKELARISDMRQLFANTKTTLSTPVGWWVIGEGFQVALFEKPTAEHIKNHEELLGWKWRQT